MKHVRHVPPGAEMALVWILAFAAIVAFRFSTIAGAGIEMGDFAANSILIQDAKSLKLTVGNYSRVGFNHPGPVILYVLALGEVIFADVLHVLSPVGGHLVAAAAFNAFWLALIYYQLRIGVSQHIDPVIFLFVFAAALAFVEGQALGGLWPPHLYILPFAALLVSAALFISGRGEALIGLALSIGTLVHGHVAFAAICAIIVLLSIAGNAALSSVAATAVPRMLGRDGLRRNAKYYAAFVLIGALFALPPVIETIRNFPGPVAQYLGYAGGSRRNGLADSLSFALYYFKPLVLFGPLLILSVLVGWPAATRSARSLLLAIVMVCLFAFVATLLYAWRGVDHLHQKYIGLYLIAAPALLVAAGIGFAARSTTYIRHRLVYAALIVVSVSLTGAQLLGPPTRQLNVPEIAELYGKIASFGPIALDLDRNVNWGRVWSSAAGVAAYGLRHGGIDFCIGQNWHILFTKALKCGAGSASLPRKRMIPATGQEPAEDVTAGFVFMDVQARSPALKSSSP